MSKHDGAPPSYPQPPPQAHYDAGPVVGANTDYYGSAPPQQYNQGYPPQPQYNQGYPPQGGMQYQQGPPPGMYQQGMYPPQDQRGHGASGAGGCCAGIMAALACCCCLDILF